MWGYLDTFDGAIGIEYQHLQLLVCLHALWPNGSVSDRPLVMSLSTYHNIFSFVLCLEFHITVIWVVFADLSLFGWESLSLCQEYVLWWLFCGNV